LHETAEGVVGLDIGPSTIAVVSTEDAALEGFCPSVIEPWKDSRRILHAMDRSRRATNPGNFDAKSISFAPNAVQTPKALESRTPPLAKGILLDRLERSQTRYRGGREPEPRLGGSEQVRPILVRYWFALGVRAKHCWHGASPLPVQTFAHQVQPGKRFTQAGVADVARGIQSDRKPCLIGGRRAEWEFSN
jgi:hypothetical protein